MEWGVCTDDVRDPVPPDPKRERLLDCCAAIINAHVRFLGYTTPDRFLSFRVSLPEGYNDMWSRDLKKRFIREELGWYDMDVLFEGEQIWFIMLKGKYLIQVEPA